MGPFRVAALISLCAVVAATAQEKPQPPQQQPTFRTGVNLVRVDAYPSRDGKILEGLTAADFELLEDGVPQKIESFQFVEFEQNAPLEERRDPNSQREAFELAADPSRRVFVLYLDNLHVNFTGSHRVRVPLTTFMNRVLNPRDLFGVLTTAQRPQDLMLGSQSRFIEEQLDKYWDWGVGGARAPEEEEDMMLLVCYPEGTPNHRLVGEVIRRRRLDAVMEDLEGLATLLAGIREERKNILLVTNGWVMSKPFAGLNALYKPSKPEIGVTSPRGPGDTGVGRITLGARNANEPSMVWCEETLQRMLGMDFDLRFRDFLDQARRSNVTFYTLKPAGLEAPFANTARTGRADANAELNWINERNDILMTLAHNTDGIPIVNTTDLTGGARQIADDLSAAYILGYYPTNAKPDGRLRKITVRVKGLGGNVRARREYRAITEGEMATMRAAREPAAPVTPADDALAELKRLRPGAVIHSRGAVIGDMLTVVTELTAPEVEAGRWKDGADVHVVVTAASGETVAMTKGRIDSGARAAAIEVSVGKAAGPFSATIRVRGTAQGNVDDAVTIARRPAALGDPLVFRFATPTQSRPAGSVYFRRTERMQVRWPNMGGVTQPTGRILGKDGVPLELALGVTEKEEAGTRWIVADLNLAPLTAGEYILEIQASSAGGATASARLAFRVFR
jgi:VWFA-related protein